MGHLSSDDIADSRKFLQKVYRHQLAEAEAGKRKLVVAGEPVLALSRGPAGCGNSLLKG